MYVNSLENKSWAAKPLNQPTLLYNVHTLNYFSSEEIGRKLMYVNSLENKSGAAKPLNQTARISPGSESELGKINLKYSKREKCIINLMFDFIPSFFKLSLKGP